MAIFIRGVLILPIAAALLTGCGSGIDRAKVLGSVSYENKPLETGMIEFYPVDGTKGPSTGGEIQQGRYDIPAHKGPLIGGAYQVRIISMRKTGKAMIDRDRRDKDQSIDLLVNVIPRRYNAQSTLKVTIASDSVDNQFDFDLQR